MARVQFTSNGLEERDPNLAYCLEREIEAAAFPLPEPLRGPLGCRIAVWGRGVVSLHFSLPGWTKVVPCATDATPDTVREAVARELAPKLLEASAVRSVSHEWPGGATLLPALVRAR